MTSKDDDYKSQINRLIIDSLEFNETGFKDIINDLINKTDFPKHLRKLLLLCLISLELFGQQVIFILQTNILFPP